MSENKNFKINRNEPFSVKVKHMKIGDVFERQGSLHMRVNCCHSVEVLDKVTICNINTGSVWNIDENKRVLLVEDCEINYNVKA